MTETTWHVGQEVFIRNVNHRRDREIPRGTIVKVGRKLVTVRNSWNQDKTYRMDTGKANDDYGRNWIQPLEQYVEERHRNDLLVKLHDLGVTLGPPRKARRSDLSNDRLERLILVLTEETR